MKNKLIKIKITILSALLLSSCGGGGGSSEPDLGTNSSNSNQTPSPFTWMAVDPEDVGLNPSKLQMAIDYALEDGGLTQSVVIIKDGKLVGDGHRGLSSNEANLVCSGLDLLDDCVQNMMDWYGDRDKNSLGTSWSTAKSFTSILIGIAIDQGLIQSVEEEASNYITEWQGDNRSTITIRNLLDMRSSLHPVCGDSSNTSPYPCTSWATSGGSLVWSDDQLSECLQSQLAEGQSQPWYYWEWSRGNFYYSNCDTQILGELLFRATGQDPFTYADTHLFSKLNMTAFWWRDNTEIGQSNGNYLTYCCIDATTSDFAKFGQMILNGGELGGQRIVSQNYIDMIKNIVNDSNVEAWLGDYSYGLKFWTISPADVVNSSGESVSYPPSNTLFSTIGFDGQYIIIDFENNMVIARNSFYQHIENLSSDRKMKLVPNNLTQSNWVASLSKGMGSDYNSTLSIQQFLLKVNESIN